MKRKITTQTVYDNLPKAPKGYSFTCERVTPRVIKVWLNHPDRLFKTDVRTIYCFVKGDQVHPARNRDKMRVEPLCDIEDLYHCNNYSVINDTHDHPSLLHL